jgi:hypothetical protein
MDAVQHSSVTTLKRRLIEAEWDTGQQSNPCVTSLLVMKCRRKHRFAGPHLLTRCTTCPMMASRALEGVSLIIPKSRNASFPSGVASRLPGCGSATGIVQESAELDRICRILAPTSVCQSSTSRLRFTSVCRAKLAMRSDSILVREITWPILFPFEQDRQSMKSGRKGDDCKLPASMIAKGSDNTRQLDKVCCQKPASPPSRVILVDAGRRWGSVLVPCPTAFRYHFYLTVLHSSACSWVVPWAGLGLTCVEEAGLEQLPQAALDARVHQLQNVQPLPLDGGQVAQLGPLDPLLHTHNRQVREQSGGARNAKWASMFQARSLCGSMSL